MFVVASRIWMDHTWSSRHIFHSHLSAWIFIALFFGLWPRKRNRWISLKFRKNRQMKCCALYTFAYLRATRWCWVRTIFTQLFSASQHISLCLRAFRWKVWVLDLKIASLRRTRTECRAYVSFIMEVCVLINYAFEPNSWCRCPGCCLGTKKFHFVDERTQEFRCFHFHWCYSLASENKI